MIITHHLFAAGHAVPMGAALRLKGVNFAVFAQCMLRMKWCVFDARRKTGRSLMSLQQHAGALAYRQGVL
jgi:hypothetical protein